MVVFPGRKERGGEKGQANELDKRLPGNLLMWELDVEARPEVTLLHTWAFQINVM